jgi:hypothetical protein
VEHQVNIWFFFTSSLVEMSECRKEVVANSAPLGIEGRSEVIGMRSLLLCHGYDIIVEH